MENQGFEFGIIFRLKLGSDSRIPSVVLCLRARWIVLDVAHIDLHSPVPDRSWLVVVDDPLIVGSAWAVLGGACRAV